MKQTPFRHQHLLFRQKQSHQCVCLPRVSLLEQPYNSPSAILPAARWLLLIKDSPIHIEAILIYVIRIEVDKYTRWHVTGRWI